jgi:uncharacterized protein
MKYKSILYSLLIILTFMFSLYGRKLIGGLVEFPMHSVWLRLAYVYAWWLLPIAIVTGALFGFRNILKELGLNRGFLTGLAFSGVAVLPMFAGAALHGSFDTNLTLIDLFKNSILPGFMEEVLFRGFLFGLLFRKLKWGFIPASLPGAIVFGIAHIYQGSGILETLGIFMVTTIGALWFAWLYIEWDDNLWVPILLHIFMNMSWTLFDVSNNALGGWQINISRIITIALTVIITVAICKRRKSLKVNGNNLFVNR